MPKQRRYGFTLFRLLVTFAALAVLSSVLMARLCPAPPPSPWYCQPSEAWVGQPIHLPPKGRPGHATAFAV